ncbi:acyl carrier protein [Salix suchowensis]|nr:acyl carrier protein [Salix suchowensis]
MASLLATPPCPLVTALPTTTRTSFSTVQQKSFSVNVSDTPISNYVAKRCSNYTFFGRPLFFGLKHAQNIRFSKAASISSTRMTRLNLKPWNKQLPVDASTVTPETRFLSMGEGGAENIATVQEAAGLIEKVKAAA